MARKCVNPKEVSKKAGISYPAFKRAWKEENVKIATIGHIAQALGCDPAEIIAKENFSYEA